MKGRVKLNSKGEEGQGGAIHKRKYQNILQDL